MKTILNKTTRPIKVPLPLGKSLHLGPRKSGEIATKAVDHPPLAKLVAAGDLEIIGDGSQVDSHKASSGSLRTSNQSKHPGVSSHRSGDR